MKTKLTMLLAPVLLFAAGASAAAPDKGDNQDLVDVQLATCAQFANAQSYAKPPGNASKKQQAFATIAQDDLVLAMTWANGYLSARDGAKGGHAFTHDWIVTYMGKLNAICKANEGSMRLADAVAKL